MAADASVTSHAPGSGRITRLARQDRNPERLNVFLDGAFAFALGVEVARREGLAVGAELSAAQVEALRAAADVGKATDAALRLLTQRPRSARELRDRLRQKGYGPATIDAAIAKLEGWRYLDDAAFARAWVENREAHRPRGRRLLEQELRRKGVDRAVVDETIAEAALDEPSAALALGQAKLRTYAGAGLEPAVVRRRLGAYLARRGYDFEVVRPVLDQLLGEPADEPEDAADPAG